MIPYRQYKVYEAEAGFQRYFVYSDAGRMMGRFWTLRGAKQYIRKQTLNLVFKA